MRNAAPVSPIPKGIWIMWKDYCVGIFAVGIIACSLGGCRGSDQQEPIVGLIAQANKDRLRLHDDQAVCGALDVIANTNTERLLGELSVAVIAMDSLPDTFGDQAQSQFVKGRFRVFEAAIDRLVGLNSPQAGKVLVSLLGSFDAYASKCVVIAITRLGKPALPSLLEYSGPDQDIVDALVISIRRGEIWEP